MGSPAGQNPQQYQNYQYPQQPQQQGQPGSSGWFPSSNPYQPGGTNAHQQQQPAVMPDPNAPQQNPGMPQWNMGMFPWMDGQNQMMPYQPPNQPQTGGFGTRADGSALDKGTLAGVRDNIQAGNMGKAKQAYEQGGGTWSADAHRHLKDKYGGGM